MCRSSGTGYLNDADYKDSTIFSLYYLKLSTNAELAP